MGELARFDGIIIKMYNYDTNKHKEPHFHVLCSNGDTASISINSLKILAGKLNRKNLHSITMWAKKNHLELVNRWHNAISGKIILKIK